MLYIRMYALFSHDPNRILVWRSVWEMQQEKLIPKLTLQAFRVHPFLQTER